MRRVRLLSLLALVLVLIFLTIEAVPVYASLEGLEQKKEEVDRELRQQKSTLKQNRSREAELSDELNRLDRRLGELQAELTRVNREIGIAEEKISRAEESLAETEADLAGKEILFKRRLRALYEQSSVSYIDVLLGASSFSDFLSRFNNLKMIAENDRQLIEEVTAELDRIEREKQKLEEEKNRLDGMRRQILSSEAELERTAASRQTVMGDLRQEIARVEQAIKELDQAERELEWQIQALSSRGTGGSLEGDSGGTLRFPVEPPHWISSPFGWRVHPIYKDWRLHTGIDIATNGQPNYILAAGAGNVIIVGYSNVFGYYITIDHGDGLSTVYKHLRAGSTAVGVGQQVTRGQRIARAGNTGRDTTGVHLHFEVRINGEPKDPMNYF
ncbi:MAG: peptidoglycan DD-metalloendopeptidase family protein [Firmicutes bacterium]|nr:peptidoglycan DD-metalloendopeptidase family protein [Bacillota bacterium]